MFKLFLAVIVACASALCSGAQSGVAALQPEFTVSPEPSLYEGNIELLLTLTTSSKIAPTGSVQFAVDGKPVGPAEQVQNNQAEYIISTPTYSVGPHTITAVYSGDANYAPLTATDQHNIIKLRSAVGLTIVTPTIYYGQTADATAQVTPTDSAPDATLNGGTITFLLDGNDICDLAITGFQETCPQTAGQGINAGMHVLVATYSGNQYYEASQSNSGNITVLPDDTNNSLATSLTPSIYGQSVTFSATLTARYATPVGPVAFFDGVTPIGTGMLNASGVASISTSTLTVGTHSITAKYAATLNFNASNSAPVQQVVVLPPPAPVGTATILTSSVNPSVLGQSVTFTASVATTGAFVQTPGGTVTFLDGASTLGTSTLDANGRAQFTTSALAVGSHDITAAYAGNSVFAANVSAILVQIVVTSLTSAGNGFLLTVTPNAFAVGVGNNVSLLVKVLPLNGFAEPVELSCTNQPAEMQCLFDSVTIPSGGGTTRLTIIPAAPHDCESDTPYFVSPNKATFFLPLLTLCSLFFKRPRKHLRKCLALSALFALLPFVSGCGHCTDLGVKPGNYTFSVQGASTGSAAVTHNVGMKMTVHL